MRFEVVSVEGCPITKSLRSLLSARGGVFVDTILTLSGALEHTGPLPLVIDDALQVELVWPLAALMHVARETGVPTAGDVRATALAEVALAGLRLAEGGAAGPAAPAEWLARAAPTLHTTEGLWSEGLARAACGACRDAMGGEGSELWLAAPAVARSLALGVGVKGGSGSGGGGGSVLPLRATPPPDIIAVTGAAGFVGSWIVKQLLERGATVHATVRSLRREAAWGHLCELPNAGPAAPPRPVDGARVCEGGRLVIFEADACVTDAEGAVFAQRQLQNAFRGARAVVHAASPYDLSMQEASQAPAALAGTRTALLAAAAESSVQRVALTSSAAAVYVNSCAAPDTVFSDGSWSDDAALAAPGFAYHAAKTAAERAAWALVEDGGQVAALRDAAGEPRLELCTFCPTQTVGPMLGNRKNESMGLLAAYADGSKKSIPRKGKCFVDVREVADAHVRALYLQKPPSRVLLVAGSVPWELVCGVLRDTLEKNAKVPTTLDLGPPAMPQAYTDCAAAWALGVRFRPISESIRDAAISLVEAGFLEE